MEGGRWKTIVESIVFMVFTAVMGGVALTCLEPEVLRIIVIAFVCGFNVGKMGGGVYQELR